VLGPPARARSGRRRLRCKAEEPSLARLRDQAVDDRDWDRAARETEHAIRARVDVVCQPVPANPSGSSRGFAGVRRVDRTYDVVDTKLARHDRPLHVALKII
jgi:hypothetical protein